MYKFFNSVEFIFFKALPYTLLILLFNCSTDNKTIAIGTFNIAWLGDGIDDKIKRNENSYSLISELIKNSNCDIMALQEIENVSALKKLLKYLPKFKYIFGSISEKQNIAVIYNKDIYVRKLEDFFPLKLNTPDLRPSLIFEVKINRIKCIVMALHLKSTSSYDSTSELKEESRNIRFMQSQIISNWIDSVHSIQKNIIILGDFNDNPDKKNSQLKPLSGNRNIFFVTSHLQSCKFKFLKSIDHIAISKSMLKKYVNNSSRVLDFHYSLKEIETENISDHCPVIANFNFE